MILQVGVERFSRWSALERVNAPAFYHFVVAPRSTDIGCVADLMIHDLEIILHLVRSPVQNIDAVGVPVLSRGEDIANARIRFENGCVANVTSSRISPERMRKIRVFQEDAYLSLDYEKQSGEICRRESGKITRDKVPIEREEPLKQQLVSFIDALKPPRVPISSDRGARSRSKSQSESDRTLLTLPSPLAGERIKVRGRPVRPMSECVVEDVDRR